MDERRAVRQGSLRQHNLGLVMREIARAVTPPSRADLAQATGMNRTTVSALVDQLVTGRLVAELPPTALPGAGRPATPLVPAARTLAAIGVEINVDYVALIALDLAGNRLGELVTVCDHRASDPARVLAPACVAIERLATELEGQGVRLAGMRMALPGLVEGDGGPLRLAPNLGWREVDVAAACRAAGLPATIEASFTNEAKAACLAELRERAGKERDFVYVSGEIGIGAAICLGGQILRGARGWSGELGHVTVVPGGRRCSCGASGCLEAYAGLDAMVATSCLPPGASAAELAQALRGGERVAVQAAERAGDMLGLALAACLNLVDVPHVVLGGAYGPLTPWLAPAIDAQLARHVLASPWSAPQVAPARAGRPAAALGAAWALLDAVMADPARWLPPAP